MPQGLVEEFIYSSGNVFLKFTFRDWLGLIGLALAVGLVYVAGAAVRRGESGLKLIRELGRVFGAIVRR